MSKLYTFEEIPAGVCWLVGIRALNGVANPSGMASLQYRLIDDGRSMFLSADNGKGGRAECIVMLPDRMTEEEADSLNFFALVGERARLRQTPTVGSA